MATVNVNILEYKTVTSGPYVEVKCASQPGGGIAPTEFLVTLQAVDLMAVLAAATTTIRAAAEPADAPAAAVLFQTTLRDGLIAKMVEKGYFTA